MLKVLSNLLFGKLTDYVCLLIQFVCHFIFWALLFQIHSVSGSMNGEAIIGFIIRHTDILPTSEKNIRSAFIGAYSKDDRNSIPINGTKLIWKSSLGIFILSSCQ